MTRRRLTATWPNSSPDWIMVQALLNVAAGVATSAAFSSVPTESCQRTRTTVSDTTAQVSRHRTRRTAGVSTGFSLGRGRAGCIDFLLDQALERAHGVHELRAAG